MAAEDKVDDADCSQSCNAMKKLCHQRRGTSFPSDLNEHARDGPVSTRKTETWEFEMIPNEDISLFARNRNSYLETISFDKRVNNI